MIEIVDSSQRVEFYSSLEEYTASGHNWCWCLVGNIVKEAKFQRVMEFIEGLKLMQKLQEFLKQKTRTVKR